MKISKFFVNIFLIFFIILVITHISLSLSTPNGSTTYSLEPRSEIGTKATYPLPDFANITEIQKIPLNITIEKIEYMGEYKLAIYFNDNTKQVIDFYPFLSDSLNPLIKKYLDLNEFKKYNLINGDLEWNDYNLCFPVADLYENNLRH